MGGREGRREGARERERDREREREADGRTADRQMDRNICLYLFDCLFMYFLFTHTHLDKNGSLYDPAGTES